MEWLNTDWKKKITQVRTDCIYNFGASATKAVKETIKKILNI